MALSAPLLTRKRVIKVLLETTKGEKIAATSAVLVFDLDIHPTSPFEERKGSGLYRGHTVKGVLGERSGVCSFRTELRANGSGGMDAGLAVLLQACGLKKTSETYQVHSTHADDETISIDIWEDGVKKGLAGVSGNVTFEGEVGKRLFCNFEFSGVHPGRRIYKDREIQSGHGNEPCPAYGRGCSRRNRLFYDYRLRQRNLYRPGGRQDSRL